MNTPSLFDDGGPAASVAPTHVPPPRPRILTRDINDSEQTLPHSEPHHLGTGERPGSQEELEELL